MHGRCPRLLCGRSIASCSSIFVGWLIIAGCAIITGCATLPAKPMLSALPEHHTVVLDQLVLHSDFPLPPQHRLLEELRTLRLDVLGALTLVPSDEPIHVYLFESEDRFHEFMKAQFPSFPTRRAFFVETDTRLAVYAHWGDRVAEDLRHEVSHGYLHSVVPRIPLWLDEGLAECFETPRGQNGLNPPHVDLLLGQLWQVGWRPRLARLEELSNAATMSQADYAEAWAWTHFLLHTTPERRRLLVDYLHAQRAQSPSESLDTQLRRWQPDAEQALVQHLFLLRPALAP